VIFHRIANLLLRDLLIEKHPGVRYSRFAWPRWVTYDHEDKRWHTHSTRREYRAWAKENMPNGYCICYPERGIVCGMHTRLAV
jgi:hypothetical protein